MLHYHIVRMEMEIQRADAERQRRRARSFDDSQIQPIVERRWFRFSRRNSQRNGAGNANDGLRFAFTSLVAPFRARRV